MPSYTVYIKDPEYIKLIKEKNPSQLIQQLLKEHYKEPEKPQEQPKKEPENSSST